MGSWFDGIAHHRRDSTVVATQVAGHFVSALRKQRQISVGAQLATSSSFSFHPERADSPWDCVSHM